MRHSISTFGNVFPLRFDVGTGLFRHPLCDMMQYFICLVTGKVGWELRFLPCVFSLQPLPLEFLEFFQYSVSVDACTRPPELNMWFTITLLMALEICKFEHLSLMFCFREFCTWMRQTFQTLDLKLHEVLSLRLCNRLANRPLNLECGQSFFGKTLCTTSYPLAYTTWWAPKELGIRGDWNSSYKAICFGMMLQEGKPGPAERKHLHKWLTYDHQHHYNKG